MKLREHAREIFWKFYQWISQLEYMHFDTQHVEIGPKMAEIAKIAWKLCENARNSEYSIPLPSQFQQYLKLPKQT